MTAGMRYKFMAYNRYRQERVQIVIVEVAGSDEDDARAKAAEVIERDFYELMEINEEH